MRRREFISSLAGAAAWPLAANAQQTRLPVVGYLHTSAPETRTQLAEAFRKGLAETGYIEGRNVNIEYRWGYDDPKRLQENIADLVRRNVAVIVTPIGTQTAIAVKNATKTIPIVFSIGTDAVKAGLIASYNRPGGNATGVAAMVSELGAKRLGLLPEMLPQVSRIGLLVDPGNPVAADTNINDIRGAASTMGIEIEVARNDSARDRLSCCSPRGEEGWCAHRHSDPAGRLQPGADYDARSAPRPSGHLSIACFCRRRRPDELRPQRCAALPARRHLCGPCTQGRAPSRHAGGAADGL